MSHTSRRIRAVPKEKLLRKSKRERLLAQLDLARKHEEQRQGHEREEFRREYGFQLQVLHSEPDEGSDLVVA